ncbi:hypothetical protein GEMRC1_003002 [Eukaryota sp. GEM-RC1]
MFERPKFSLTSFDATMITSFFAQLVELKDTSMSHVLLSLLHTFLSSSSFETESAITIINQLCDLLSEFVFKDSLLISKIFSILSTLVTSETSSSLCELMTALPEFHSYLELDSPVRTSFLALLLRIDNYDDVSKVIFAPIRFSQGSLSHDDRALFSLHFKRIGFSVKEIQAICPSKFTFGLERTARESSDFTTSSAALKILTSPGNWIYDLVNVYPAQNIINSVHTPINLIDLPFLEGGQVQSELLNPTDYADPQLFLIASFSCLANLVINPKSRNLNFNLGTSLAVELIKRMSFP